MPRGGLHIVSRIMGLASAVEQSRSAEFRGFSALVSHHPFAIKAPVSRCPANRRLYIRTLLALASHLLDRDALLQFGEKIVVDHEAEPLVGRLCGDVGVVSAPGPRVQGIFGPFPKDRTNVGSLSYPRHR